MPRHRIPRNGFSGRELGRAMRRLQVTERVMALAVGVPKHRVADWKRGHGAPSAAQREAIDAALESSGTPARHSAPQTPRR